MSEEKKAQAYNELLRFVVTGHNNHYFKELWKIVEKYIPNDHTKDNGVKIETGKPDYNSVSTTAYYMNKKIVDLLIANGADVNARDNDGKTVLDYKMLHHPHLVELLREHGAKTAAELNDLQQSSPASVPPSAAEEIVLAPCEIKCRLYDSLTIAIYQIEELSQTQIMQGELNLLGSIPEHLMLSRGLLWRVLEGAE